MGWPDAPDKIFIDVRQNSERLSMVVPYSLRATDRPTISTPVARHDLERAVATRDRQLLVNEASTADPVVQLPNRA